MLQLVIFIAIFVGPWLIAFAAGWDTQLAGRLGVALIFLMAALGHFVKTGPMSEMLPPSVPARKSLTVASGFLELVIGLAVLFAPSRGLGWLIIVFLAAVFPLNVYAAIRRVPFGGHRAGPIYLLARAPVQLALMAWTYRFLIAVR